MHAVGPARWTMTVLVVGLAALVAGCAQPPTAALPVEVTEAAPTTLDLRQADCESITWSVPVLATSLQPHLPPGFEPSPHEPSGTSAPTDLEGAATLGFRAVECAIGLGVEDVLRSVQTGWIQTPVIPPTELREERFGARYTYSWDVLVAPDGWRAAAGAWELPLRDGGALVGPSAQGWTGMLAMDQVGSFAISGRSLDSSRPATDFEARSVTLGAQGLALWDAEAVNVTVSTGVGLWTASPESWVAQLLGATQGVASFEYCTFDVVAGSVHWPGQALGPVEEDDGPVVDLPPLPPSMGLPTSPMP